MNAMQIDTKRSITLHCLIFLQALIFFAANLSANELETQSVQFVSDYTHGMPKSMPVESLRKKVARVTAKLDGIFEDAGEVEELQVILQLHTDFLPEGLLNVASLSSQRNLIQAAQERTIEKLTKKFKVSKDRKFEKFKTVPYMAVRIARDEILDFAELDEISDVYVDELSEPSMEESNGVISADIAWASGYNGSGQYVAVLDTGVDKAHPFLTGKVVSEACYSNAGGLGSGSSLCPGGITSSTAGGSGINCSAGVTGCDHGTHVAGTVAGDNGSISGVAPGAGLIAINIFTNISGKALSYTSDQIKGLERVYALRSTYDIASVNMSLGGGSYSSHCDGDSRKAIIDNLRSVGIATVIATGNNSYTSSISAPACISSAISVGSTGDGSYGAVLDEVSSFSNSSTLVDLLAPGQWITSSVPGGGYSIKQGTSMATPHVAGAWAVLKSANDTATVSDIESALKSTGVSVIDAKNGINKPRIDVFDAIASFGTGSISVNLSPSGATSDGAQWRIDSGAWNNSGTSVSGINVGLHEISFKSISHSNPSKVWATPNRQTATLSFDGDSASLSAIYTQADKSDNHFDISGDGMGDLLLSSSSDGSVYVWIMDGTTINTRGYVTRSDGSVPKLSDWEVSGSADMNGDGKSDIILRNKNDGSFYLWIMDGTSISSSGYATRADGSVPKPSSWDLAGIADLSGDGKSDIILRSKSDASFYLWSMDGMVIGSAGYLQRPDTSVPKPSSWNLAGIADFNGDGKADILLESKNDGSLYAWIMDGMSISERGYVERADGSVPQLGAWVIAGCADLNGDGISDIVLRNKNDASLYLWSMNGRTISSGAYITRADGSVPEPSAWNVAGLSDINGDGKADILLRSKSDGAFYLWSMDGTSISSAGYLERADGSVPIPSADVWSLAN